jgi:hypothetical protein
MSHVPAQVVEPLERTSVAIRFLRLRHATETPKGREPRLDRRTTLSTVLVDGFLEMAGDLFVQVAVELARTGQPAGAR